MGTLTSIICVSPLLSISFNQFNRNMSAISCTIAPVVVAKASTSSPKAAVPVAAPKAFTGLKAATFFNKTEASPFVSNGCNTNMMMVWTPVNNLFFETFSYLPPLNEKEITSQIEYMTKIGATPCLEFAKEDKAYTIRHCEGTGLDSRAFSGYYDNRYWTMWKLPMFGCTDPSQVLAEVAACKAAFPDAYIRVCGFNNLRQVQVVSFLVNRPTPAIATNERSV